MPRSVKTEEDFQAFLDVLRVEQVMGLRMHRVRDLPFYADIRARDHRGNVTLEGSMYLDGNEVLVVIVSNSFSDAPELQDHHVLTPLQAEEVAALFGCRPRLRISEAAVASSLGDHTHPDAWLHWFSVLLSHEDYSHIPTADKAGGLRLLYDLLNRRFRYQGHLRGTSPNELWQMLCEQLRIKTPE